MPGMTGFEVTKKLKSDFDTSHIPIILLTALSSPEKHLEGIEAGADAYIAKPFSVKLLLARVFRLIEQRDKLREKFSSEPGIVRPAMCTLTGIKNLQIGWLPSLNRTSPGLNSLLMSLRR